MIEEKYYDNGLRSIGIDRQYRLQIHGLSLRLAVLLPCFPSIFMVIDNRILQKSCLHRCDIPYAPYNTRDEDTKESVVEGAVDL